MAAMSAAELDAFLRETRIAKLASLHADGRPTTIPVWFEWDGRIARVFTGKDAAKVRRIQGDPRVALTVDTGVGEPEAWVTIEADARIVEGDVMPLVRRLAERYYPPEKAAAMLREWEAGAANMVTIELEPVRIRSMSSSE